MIGVEAGISATRPVLMSKETVGRTLSVRKSVRAEETVDSDHRAVSLPAMAGPRPSRPRGASADSARRSSVSERRRT